jgi:hypothetical protein
MDVGGMRVCRLMQFTAAYAWGGWCSLSMSLRSEVGQRRRYCTLHHVGLLISRFRIMGDRCSFLDGESRRMFRTV